MQMSLTVEISVHLSGIQKWQLFRGRLFDQMLQVILLKRIHHLQRTWIVMNRVVLDLEHKAKSEYVDRVQHLKGKALEVDTEEIEAGT